METESSLTAAPSPIRDDSAVRQPLRLHFGHGLGDCFNWARALVLWRRRGYRVQVKVEAAWRRRGGRLISIDNNQEHLATARCLLQRFGGFVELVQDDSAAWLRRNRGPIDLLYLDPLHAEHCLGETIAATLVPGSTLISRP